MELDIHATRDGAIVVHHGAALEGLGRIADQPLETVQQHRLSNGKTVPLLSEVLSILRGIDVWVEVKGIEEYLDAVLLRTLQGGPEPERYAVHSFDHRIIRRLGERDGALRRGVLLDARLIDPLPVLAAAGATVLWQAQLMVDRALVDEVHRAGRRMIALDRERRGRSQAADCLRGGRDLYPSFPSEWWRSQELRRETGDGRRETGDGRRENGRRETGDGRQNKRGGQAWCSTALDALGPLRQAVASASTG